MYWNLPGVQGFLSEVVQSLERQKHVIILCPETVMRENPALALRRRLADEGLGSIEWLDVSPNVHENPLEALIKALNLGRMPASFDALLGSDTVPFRFMGLLGIEKGDMRRQRMFADLLMRAGDHAQSCIHPPYLIIALTSPIFEPPPQNVRLVCHSWWGVINQLDIDCVTVKTLSAFHQGRTTEYYWAMSLVRGIAPTDPRLVELLIETLPRTLNALLEQLKEYARDLPSINCTGLAIGTATRSISFRKPLPPSNGKECTLWSQGLLDWCNGKGTMLHAAVLATVGNMIEIEKRVLLGQQEVIFPLVERVRQAIVAWFNREFGNTWIDQVARNLKDDQQKDSMICEIGPLCHHIFTPPIFRHAHADILTKLAWRWKEIRNDLAHGKVIDYDTLDWGLSLYEEFEENTDLSQ